MTRSEDGVPMSERLRTDYGWTDRQRQVLDLLSEGRSNSEIAETLGISLAGAKFHVSEILSKLQAETREEAADYWRRHEGLAPRFGRTFRGAIRPSIAKGAALLAGLIVLALSAVVVIVLANGGGDSSPAAPTATTPPASPSATQLTPTPGASPSAPAASPTATSAAIPGLAVRPTMVTVATPQGLPAGWTLYAWHLACYGCDGSFADVRRWASDGRTVSGDFLFSFTQPPPAQGAAGGVYTVAFGSDGRRVAAGLCTRGYCGGMAEPSADATAELFRSDDGGRTWRNLGALARGAFVAGFVGDDVVVEQTSFVNGRYESTFATATGQPLGPAGFATDRVVTGEGRDPVWVQYARNAIGDRNHLRSTHRDAGGAVNVPLSDTDAVLLGVTGIDGYIWELHTKDDAGQAALVVAIADRSGTVRRAVRADLRFWSIRSVSRGRYLVGYGEDASLGAAPTPFIVDLNTGTLTPLSGLPHSQAETYTYPLALLPGPSGG